MRGVSFRHTLAPVFVPPSLALPATTVLASLLAQTAPAPTPVVPVAPLGGPAVFVPAVRPHIRAVRTPKPPVIDGKLANVEFDTIPNVKDPWKELNPPK